MKATRRVMQSDERSDADVLEAVRNGDTESLGVLFDRYADDVMRFARRLVPEGEADDLTQETFVRVLSVARSYEGRNATARAWILGIAFSIVRERRRSFARFRRAVASFGRSVATTSASGEPDTDLARAIRKLDDDRGALVVMVDGLGLTTREAAMALGVPEGTIGSRLFHARRELRELLGGSDA